MLHLPKTLQKAFRRRKPAHRPLIVDACLLFNEIDLLEIRLAELWEVVDRFVIVESDRTHAGRPKPFFFEEFSSVFERFAGKITYHKFIDESPRLRTTTRERLEFEAAQRNAIGSALELCGLHSDDIVVLCDVDEIPRPELIATLPTHLARKPYCIFVTRNFRGYINNTSTSALNGRPFLGPVACRWKTFRAAGAQAVRRDDGRAGHVLDRKNRRWAYVDDGGWHLSSMGGAEAFWVKAQNFSHVKDPYRVLRLPATAIPIQAFTGRSSRQDCASMQMQYLATSSAPRFSPLGFDDFRIEQDLPGYLVANKERFRRFFFFTDIVDLRTGQPTAGGSAVALQSVGGPPVPSVESAALNDESPVVDMQAPEAIMPAHSIEVLLKAIARRLLRPGLHFPGQYRPRALAIPRSYYLEGLPSHPPSIAIVTPSYNQAPFIGDTIDSVLAQGYPRLRYMVMDGNSSDGTGSILSSHGGKLDWRSEADAGQADAINKGFARLSGDIMSWLNSDDLLLPGTLAYVARFFTQHPEVDLVYGHRIYIDSSGQEIGRAVLPSHDRRALTYFDYIPQETLFWRNRVWAAVGPLDASLEFAMDWDFLLRSAAAGFTFRRLPRFLGCFRSHSQQKSSTLATDGKYEADELRMRQFKRSVSMAEISRGIRTYRIRQLAWQWAYRLGLPVS